MPLSVISGQWSNMLEMNENRNKITGEKP